MNYKDILLFIGYILILLYLVSLSGCSKKTDEEIIKESEEQCKELLGQDSRMAFCQIGSIVSQCQNLRTPNCDSLLGRK